MYKQKNKGITLIALIITIIVLLILSGVSIAMLTGPDGLINEAFTAKEKFEEATYKEKIDLSRVKSDISLKRESTLDEWIEQIYKEKIVPKGSITKTSDYEAKVVTPEGYIIFISTDAKEPFVVLGDDKIIIDDVVINTLGDIKADLDKPENEWGKNYKKGLIFKYNGEYFIVKFEQNLNRSNYEQMIQERNGFVKLNPEKGFTTPSESTVEGDFKYENGKVYVYTPYGDDPEEYKDPNWWVEVIEP